MLKVKGFEFNHFGESTYVVYDDDPQYRQAIIVDAGMLFDDEEHALERFLAEKQLTLTAMVNTHLHIDHVFGIPYLRQHYPGLKLYAGGADQPLGNMLPQQAQKFGMTADMEPVVIDVALHQGDTIPVGQYNLKVLEVPGHSPGSIALYSPDGNFVITGDALFRGSIGRTDLPGGSHQQLLNSIRQQLYTLPPETMVLPGHGPFSTIEQEIKTNPFTR